MNTYHADVDVDTYGGVAQGWMCQSVAEANVPPHVTNQIDIDDNCNCVLNNSTCYDDCGNCNGSNTTNTTAVCGTAALWNQTNCDNMDCGGVCGGSAVVATYYTDLDGDNLGSDTSQGALCSSDSLMITGTGGHSWVANTDDLDDTCKCTENTDAACKDECGICAGSFTTADCADGSCYASSGNSMDCAGVCSTSTPASQGAAFGANAGTFGSTYNNYYEDYDGDTYADRRFSLTSENIFDYMSTSQGYAVNRVYVTGSNDDPQFWNNGYYAGGEPLPSYLLKPGFSWDGDANDIITEINCYSTTRCIHGSIIDYFRIIYFQTI